MNLHFLIGHKLLTFGTTAAQSNQVEILMYVIPHPTAVNSFY